jgi:CubicO group peptidase (beta-lactamase class C family)
MTPGAHQLHGKQQSRPATPPNARNITLRQLLNHTSGLFNVDEDEAYGDAAVLWNDTLLLRSPDVADTLLEVVRLGR